MAPPPPAGIICSSCTDLRPALVLTPHASCDFSTTRQKIILPGAEITAAARNEFLRTKLVFFCWFSSAVGKEGRSGSTLVLPFSLGGGFFFTFFIFFSLVFSPPLVLFFQFFGFRFLFFSSFLSLPFFPFFFPFFLLKKKTNCLQGKLGRNHCIPISSLSVCSSHTSLCGLSSVRPGISPAAALYQIVHSSILCAPDRFRSSRGHSRPSTL